MNKAFRCFLFSIILMFFFQFTVNAECSYQERKELLDNAKKVDIFIERAERKELVELYNDGSSEYRNEEIIIDYFKLNITNLSDDLYIKVSNSDNLDDVKYIFDYSLVDGIYSLDINDITKIIKYNFEFKSNNPNCLGYDVNKKTIIKPRYNHYSDLELCKLESTKEHKYCKKYIDKNYNESTMFNTLQNLSLNEEENNESNKVNKISYFFSNYWYLFVLIIFLIILIMVLIIKRRKKYEL